MKKLFKVTTAVVVMAAVILISTKPFSSQKKLDDTMSLGKTSTVAGFPISTCISGGKQLELDILGKESLSVQDSVLLVSTRNSEGLWSVYDISTNDLIGSYIKLGRASEEVIFPPRVNGSGRVARVV